MRLAEPSWLGLMTFAVLPWLWLRRRPRVAWPTLDGFAKTRRWPARLGRVVPATLRVAAILCLSVAVARPQVPGGTIRVAGRGVAIVAVVDRSSSMKAVDFPGESGPVSRLEAAKGTLGRFVRDRSDDLVGLVTFANYPDLIAAPTLDQRFLAEAVRSIRTAGPIDDGTNIGDALIVALGAIRDSPTRRKVIILLTDGRNAPAVPRPFDPIEAAGLARSMGVTLHSIAVGRTPSKADKPDDGPDLPWLERLAKAGGGQSFVAADSDALDRVFEEIDGLEKSPVTGSVRTIYNERYAPWAAAALALIAVDLLASSIRLRRLP